jgi:hypothetical protein
MIASPVYFSTNMVLQPMIRKYRDRLSLVTPETKAPTDAVKFDTL